MKIIPHEPARRRQCRLLHHSVFTIHRSKEKAGQQAGFFCTAEKLLLFVFLHFASRSSGRSLTSRFGSLASRSGCRGRRRCRSRGGRRSGCRSGCRGGRRSGFFTTGVQTQTKCKQRSEEERAFHVFSLDKKESYHQITAGRRETDQTLTTESIQPLTRGSITDKPGIPFATIINDIRAILQPAYIGRDRGA